MPGWSWERIWSSSGDVTGYSCCGTCSCRFWPCFCLALRLWGSRAWTGIRAGSHRLVPADRRRLPLFPLESARLPERLFPGHQPARHAPGKGDPHRRVAQGRRPGASAQRGRERDVLRPTTGLRNDRRADSRHGGVIEFDYVPEPNDLKQTILEQQSLRLQHYQASGKMVIQHMLEERLGMELSLPPRVTTGANGNGYNGTGRWRRRIAEAKAWVFPPRDPNPTLVVWRKHWLVLLGKILMPLAVLMFILMLLTGQQFIPPSLHNLVAAADLALAVISLITFLWFLWQIADWRNDTYEVDLKQIADVAKKPLFFAENRKTALLSEIENVEFAIPSPINYIFNFGNVRIQTAATEGDFTFDWVPNPRFVSDEIWRRVEAYRARQETDRARQRAEELPDWFEMYDRLGVDIQRETTSQAPR